MTPTCEICACEMTGEDTHMVEAYETTGQIMCDDCFDEMCEADAAYAAEGEENGE